ncbi:MAG: fibronectin type III domain-containing protein, partial [Clostridia bacterium]|nr:fibronectin type III domain-containing protein [Clostridia bacterium]
MKPETKWSYSPYTPPLFDAGDIYICRIAPGKTSAVIEWLGDENAAYTVHWTKRGENGWRDTSVTGTSVTLTDLEDETEYEVQVACGTEKSRVRHVKTGFVPGDAVINYLHPEDGAYKFSGQYLCSPSMVRHPDGHLLASMDVFKGAAPQNLTLIFRSDDDGATWKYVCELFPCFWGRMFIHKGELYMLSCSTEYGDLLIGKSTDGGKTFSKPVCLLRGTGNQKEKGIHKNPQKMLE